MSNKDTAEKNDSAKQTKNLKKLKYGSISIIAIVLVIAIVVIFNIICGIVEKRSPIKVDLTPDNRYELTDESITVLRDLKQDVEITITFSKDDFKSLANYYKQMAAAYNVKTEWPYDMIPVILEKYQMYAEQGEGSISVRYIDMNKDPDVIAKYKKYYSGDITEGNIIVFAQNGDAGRVKVLDQEDIINMIKPDQTSSQTSMNMVFAGESTLTSAIMNVTDTHPIRTAFALNMNGQPIYGQGYEKIAKNLEDFLSKNGYDCTEIDLASDDLSPDDYDFTVIPMPAVDFNSDIVNKLGDFLYNDGEYQREMLFIPNLTATNTPVIDEFLADWSIQVENAVIVDEQNYITTLINSAYDLSPVLSIADTKYVGVLPNEALPIVSPLTKDITILTKNGDSVAAPVLQSTDKAYTSPLAQGANYTDTPGVRNAAVISTKETAAGVDVLSSKLLVIGSSFFTYDGEYTALLQQTNTYNNANVLLGMLNTMTGKESAAVIPEKALQQAIIAPTAKQENVIKVFVIFIIPLLVAAAGIIVYVRRRNR